MHDLISFPCGANIPQMTPLTGNVVVVTVMLIMKTRYNGLLLACCQKYWVKCEIATEMGDVVLSGFPLTMSERLFHHCAPATDDSTFCAVDCPDSASATSVCRFGAQFRCCRWHKLGTI